MEKPSQPFGVDFVKSGEQIVQVPARLIIAQYEHEYDDLQGVLQIEVYRKFMTHYPEGRDEFSATLAIGIENRSWNNEVGTERRSFYREGFISLSSVWNWVSDAACELMEGMFPGSGVDLARGVKFVDELSKKGRSKRELSALFRARQSRLLKLKSNSK
jgi:hypothetical protein